MKIELMKQFLEEHSEHLNMLYFQYLITNPDDLSNEEIYTVDKFVKWVQIQNDKDIVEPRGKEGKSYVDYSIQK